MKRSLQALYCQVLKWEDDQPFADLTIPTEHQLTDSECLRVYEEWEDDQPFADFTIPTEHQGAQHDMSPQPSTSHTTRMLLGDIAIICCCCSCGLGVPNSQSVDWHQFAARQRLVHTNKQSPICRMQAACETMPPVVHGKTSLHGTSAQNVGGCCCRLPITLLDLDLEETN